MHALRTQGGLLFCAMQESCAALRQTLRRYCFEKECIEMANLKFPRVAPEAVGLRSEDLEWLLDELESGFTEMHGLMVMRHGKICAEGWWAPYGPGVRHGLQSLSKTYAATAVGIAVTEGLLRLEDRVIDIFPEDAPADPSENLQKLTVRDVLCMGCGMDTMPAPTLDWIRQFLATPVNHLPGTTYMYNSMGSTLLGAMVRKVSGQGVQEYLKPRLFDKIGICADNLRWLTMPDGLEVGGGGLFATTEDNLRLMLLYKNGGVWNGERILSEEYAAKAVSLQNESATEAIGNPEAFDNFVGYGFQIWMCQPEGVYRADGAMGQFSVVIPKLDMIISLNETATGAHWAQKTLDTLWQYLKRVEAGEPTAENPVAAAHLARRMKHLAIEAPAFAPFSPMAAKVSGKTYTVTEGELSLDLNITGGLSGTPGEPGMEEFSFAFDTDHAVLRYTAGGETACVHIGTDGTRWLNLLPLKHSPLSRVYLAGAWESEDTFSVAVRWVETCFESRLDFTFAGDEVTVSRCLTVGGFGPISAEMRQVGRAKTMD